MKKRQIPISFLVALLFTILPAFAFAAQKKKQPKAVYQDASQPIEMRIKDLVGRMTIEEKAMQLTQAYVGENDNSNNHGFAMEKLDPTIGSLIYIPTEPELRNKIQKQAMTQTRLGIPLLFGYDIIHGYRTIMPIPLAQACAWNPSLVEQSCRIAAQEGKMSGIDWTFSPMIDVSRDPRWGRMAESYGEDPYANGIFAQAAVRGYQGTDNNHLYIAACLKHYVGYGASEAGRDYVYTEISRPTLWNTYLYPYQMGVEAGAATIMSGFNDISGTPATANYYTLTEVLRNKWDFKGLVVSDWGAVSQLINQGMAKDLKETTHLCLNAGVDMDMQSNCYSKYLKELVDEGKITMATVDEAVSRVLRVKFQLGLFENPYTPVNPTKKRFLQPQSLQLANNFAEESMVLLKNDGILPLHHAKRILVVGPLADNGEDLIGMWSGHGDGKEACRYIDGLKQEFSSTSEITYVKGCNFETLDSTSYQQALTEAKSADVIIACLGEPKGWTGENTSRTNISLPEAQQEFLQKLASINSNIVMVLATGRPVIIDKIVNIPKAILETWHPGTNGASAMAGILSGRINPSGRLAVTFPLNQGQIPIYYDSHNPSRVGDQGRYQDSSSAPLYPFGYGLSYTQFQYGKITASTQVVDANGKLHLEIPVTNSGKVDGKETVFWYVRNAHSIITRPIKELKHFEKRLIKAGTTETFAFDVDVKHDLGYMDGDGKLFLDPGEVDILVGNKKVTIQIK